jgi:hypothetical protein
MKFTSAKLNISSVCFLPTGGGRQDTTKNTLIYDSITLKTKNYINNTINENL